MKREGKLVILVFLLAVGPAVLLSLFAVRVLQNWQVVLQKRLENEAARVLEQCVTAWEGQFRTSNIQRNGPKAPDDSPFDVGSSMLNVRSSFFPWVDGIFVFRPGDGLVYPPADPAPSSFVPPSVVPEDSLRAAALLQQAAALRAAGETNEAVKVLREVAGTSERRTSNSQHRTSNIEREEPRDPDEGFCYDLIALKLLGDVEEARRRVLARYDTLVPLQRDLMVEFIEQGGEKRTSNIQHSTLNIERAKAPDGSPFDVGSSMLNVQSSDSPLIPAWQERMRGRALSAADRAVLAAEVGGLVGLVPEKGWTRGRVGGRDALVGREQGAGSREQGAGKQEFIALQFSEGNLIDHLNGLFATVTGNSSIRVVTSRQGAVGRGQGAGSSGKDDFKSEGLLPTASCFLPPVLGSQRLPPPLESIVLEAVPADPQAFLANARLQSRLYGVGGGLLLVSVVAGVWLIWRQAAGEIREARARTDFAAAVSHDLRTPLASMRMLAESLYMGNVTDPAKTRTFLGAILKESDRLSRLTDRALYFIRYGQGARRYEFNGSDLGALVKDVVHTFAVGLTATVEERDIEQKERKETKGVGISADMSAVVPKAEGVATKSSLFPSFPSVQTSSAPVVRLAVDAELPRVRFDDGAMEQVVYNLLDNAVKYSSKEKGVVIGVSVEARPRRRGAEVVLSVSDQGLGMAPDEVRRVLKPYARGRGGAQQNAKGVGLGLALCHHVVKAHGGRIEIVSEVGKGTTFSLILPAEG